MSNNKQKTPEELARENIDRWLDNAGWEVVDRDEITTGLQAQAVREGLLKGNLEADYVLFLGGRAIGVLEAKRVEVDVMQEKVRQQALKYTHKVPKWVMAWTNPLPMVYVSNGKDLYFVNQADPDYDAADPQWQPLTRIFTPKESADMLHLKGEFVRMPSLTLREKSALRNCQREAVQNIEESFRAGKRRALVVLATGAGKTFTACMEAYRLLNNTDVKRILYLVDRNNLGTQAQEEFGTFRLTENGESFSSIFGVEKLKSPQISSDTNVVISTIQRLYSILTGQEITDGEDDESDFDAWNDQEKEYTFQGEMLLPDDAFDLIIVDECHRSIYSTWRKVLDYFAGARIIGLTATPSPETYAFFDKNRVINYTLDESVRDGINVACTTYTIDTLLSQGGTIRKGERVTETAKLTDRDKEIRQDEDETFDSVDINRRVVIPGQIRLILTEFKNIVYTKLYPQRAEVDPAMRYIPKTLIYALDDKHATRIVDTLRELFPGQDPRFVQKITYSAGDSNALIKSFRNDREFRIAVTVTLVATGTDVKPLEIVMFMRDVSSELLYVQMKGRGVRTISDEALRIVTPNADSKDKFYLIDAVGVTRHAHKIPDSHDWHHTEHLTIEQVLERLVYLSEAGGDAYEDLVSDLYNRLVRINNRTKASRLEEFRQIAGVELWSIVGQLFEALYGERKQSLAEILLPLTSNPAARNKIIEMAHGYVTTLPEVEDTMVFSDFSQEEALATTSAFEEYITSHADDIEALRIIYNNSGEPLTYSVLTDLRNRLLAADRSFDIPYLWNCYHILNHERVRELSGRDERAALTNIIALVRYAYHQSDNLASYLPYGTQRFNLWCGQMQRSLTKEQQQIMRQVLDYILANGACPIDDLKATDESLAARLIVSYKSYDEAEAALISLSEFVLRGA